MTEERKPEGDLFQELQALGQQLSTALKGMWETEESRKLRMEISEGFMEVGRQVDTAIKSAQESQAAKQFGDQVKEAVDRVRESDLAAELEEGLVTGLHELNRGLSKFVDSLQPSGQAKDDPEAGTESEG